MEQVARENGHQGVVDGELYEPRQLVSVRARGLRTVHVGERATGSDVVLASPDESLEPGDTRSLVERLIDGAPGIRDRASILLAQ